MSSSEEIEEIELSSTSSNAVEVVNTKIGVDYSSLYNQKELLCDQVRMDAYYNAIFDNRHHFEGKVVLDVGTGSGILAIWAGQAGARQVYAVEPTTMAHHAQSLVNANHLEDVIEVIHSSMEDVYLPERVDVIISDWMGPFLLGESMFDSVIFARDNWLKPTGVMYPSHARMWLAPVISEIRDEQKKEYDEAMGDWLDFIDETKTNYGIDMSGLTDAFQEECKKYYLETSLWCNLRPDEVVARAVVIKEIDCATETADGIKSLATITRTFISAKEGARLTGFAGWFDVHFQGSKVNPAEKVIELTTAPSEENCTHWGQQMFVLDRAVDVNMGDQLWYTLIMRRSRLNPRSLEFTLSCDIDQVKEFIKKTFYIECGDKF